MLRAITRTIGGYAYERRDLRLLYAAIFLSFLGASLTFPLRLLYAQAHGASPTQLGLLAGSFVIAPLLVQVPLGWLVDHWGRVPVLLIGLIAHPIISLLYIPLNSPWELIALRTLEGLTVAAFQPSINAYIADVTPEEHRAEAYGALGATLNGGMLLGPLIGGIIGQTFGFGVAFLANGAIELLAIPLVVGHVHEPAVHRGAGESGPRVGTRSLFILPLMVVYVGTFCVQATMGLLGSLWSIYIHDLGGSYTLIGITFTVFALPQILLGTIAGRLADRRGRLLFTLVSGGAAAVIYAAYGFMTNLLAICLLGVIEGVAIVFLTPVVQRLLADASPPTARGRAQGVSGAAGSIGGALAAFTCLPLYHQSHPLPFVLAGGVMVVGTAAAGTGVTLLGRRAAAGAAIEARRSA